MPAINSIICSITSRPQILVPFLAIMAIFVISNKLVTIAINDWLTWGAFTFPLVFLVTDLTNRSCGPSVARKVAWLSLPFALGISWWWANGQIAVASGLAFIVGQLMDIAIFNRLRQQSWWLAPWGASMLGSVVDTLLFFSIAFYDATNPNWPTVALQFGLGDLGIKWFMACLLLAPYRALLPRLSAWGGMVSQRY